MRSLDGRFAYSSRNLADTTSSLDFGSLAVPFRVASRPVTLQAGWRRLYQLSGTFDGAVLRRPLGGTNEPAGSSIFRQDRVRGDVDLLSLAGAVRLTDRMLVGGSFDVWRGDWSELIAVAGDRDPVMTSGPSDFAALSRDNRIRGHNFSAGLLLTHTAWNAGFVYHSPFWSSYRVRQEFRSSRTDTLAGAADDARFRFPRSFGLGAAWRPAPRWTLALDATHDRWSDFLVVGIPFAEGPVNFFDSQPPGFTSTRDTLSFNLGAEHLFQKDRAIVPLRFGIAWEPQGPMDPLLRDPVSYVVLAAGAGYNTNTVKFDASVEYRWASYRSSDTVEIGAVIDNVLRGAGPDAEGRSRTREWRVKVSMIYRLADTDKLRGALRKLFVGS